MRFESKSPDARLGKPETVFADSSDGLRLAAHRLGSGPPLYVLHGGPMNDHRIFGDYLNPIAEYRTLHLLDQRGCGDSEDSPPSGYTLARLAEDVEDTRAGLHHETIDLLGHSYGGLIALHFALRWPERVKTLIIAGTPIRGRNGVLLSPRAWATWASQIIAGFKKDTNWTEFALRHDVGNRARVDEVRAVYLVTKRYDPARSSPLMREAMRSIDVTSLAGRMRAVAIFGKQDRRFVWDAPHLRSMGFRLHLIDTCGHSPYIEQPERFHSIIKRSVLPEVPADA